MKAFGAAALLWAAWLLFASSDGARWIVDFLFLVYGGIFFAGFWVFASAYELWYRERARAWWCNAWTYVVPAVLATTFVALWTDAAFKLRFHLSKPKLEQFAEGFPAGAERSDVGWVGLFDIEWCDSPGNSVRMVTGYCGVDRCGIVYSPSGVPPVVGEDSYWPMEAPWWFWHRSF